MKLNSGCDVVNLKGIMDSLNVLSKNAHSPDYASGINVAKNVIKSYRVLNPNDLENRVKKYAFNHEINLNDAADIVIRTILSESKKEDLYMNLFGC